MTITRLWSSSSVGICRRWRHPWNTFKRKVQSGPLVRVAHFVTNDTQGELEWQLLKNSESYGQDRDLSRLSNRDMATAPLLTREAYIVTQRSGQTTQYGVLGRALAIHSKGASEVLNDQRLYMNTNAPFSAIVCGVQGSGKSYTVSAMLENMLIPKFPPIGSLTKPLCGLVLHFGEGGSGSLPNETAWISQSLSSHVKGPPVRVYVSRSNLQTMRAVYAHLSNVIVEPLLLHNSELDAAAILSMMAVESVESPPLYMQIVLSILRELGEKFTFSNFMARLEESKQQLSPSQLSNLLQRLSLLNSFLEPPQNKDFSTKSKRFSAGQLTIIDLSDPFLSAASACGLFEIIVRLFIRAEVDTGKVLVVDEAHKYLSENSTNGLTKSLLSLVRQQRHLAMRVIISTQEPTVIPPVFLDLCTVAIMHRFSSPTWWQHLIQHVPTDFSQSGAFDQIVRLQTGQAIVLSPSGIGLFPTSEDASDAETKVLSHFGRRYIVMKTRQRVTADGGGSILVLNN